MKEIISQLGKLADARPANLGAGYLVDRPELLRHCLRCWAPCGCCVTYMNANAYVYTACDAATEELEHGSFAWEDAKRAIEAFLAAEERSLTVLEKVQEVESETSEESSESLAERSPEGSPEVRPSPELET